MTIQKLPNPATTLLASLAMLAIAASAQQAPTPPASRPQPAATAKTVTAPATEEGRDNIVTLTPFEVSARADTGYGAATTLAGNRPQH